MSWAAVRLVGVVGALAAAAVVWTRRRRVNRHVAAARSDWANPAYRAGLAADIRAAVVPPTIVENVLPHRKGT